MSAADPQDGAPHVAPADVPEDVRGLLPLTALRDAWAAEAEAARVARVAGRPRGPVTGFTTLDRHLGGYLRPGVHFVHGEPGTGKTAYLLQVAAQCGAPALFVSCEVAPVVLLRRVIARLTDTYVSRLDDGELSPAEMLALFDRAAAACPMLALVDGTAGYVAPWQLAHDDAPGILELAAAWRERCGAPHVLVCVDSLHTWAARGASPAATEYETLNAAIADLERLAHTLRAPVLAVAERPRSGMKDAGQSAGKGTARIEYAAESVVSLNRETDTAGRWPEDGHRERQLYASLAKNRHGDTGRRVDMRFHGALMRLREA